MNLQETRDLLTRFSLQPIHTLGQNFLVEEKIVDLALEQAGIDAHDLVIEIGAGLGALTSRLARQAQKVITIEIDRYVLPALKHVLQGQDNVEIIHEDARAVDFRQLAGSWPGTVKVMANLPYYITSPLVEKIYRELPRTQKITIMVQREAAARITAAAGGRQYGPLAVLTSLYGKVEKLIKVPRGSFYPQPHVDSVLLCLRRENNLPRQEWPELAEFLHQSFTSRRKTIQNSWRQSELTPEQTRKLTNKLQSMNLEANIRPETLTPGQYLALFTSLQDTNI